MCVVIPEPHWGLIPTQFLGDKLLTAGPVFLNNLNQYLHLKHVISPSLNSHSIRTQFWLENICHPIQDTPLPIALFLIDPMFYERRNGSNFIPRASNARTFSGPHHGNCEIGKLVLNAECTGKPLVGDHQWPHSLGGETLGDNLLKLCPSCNRQKSSSILYYPWGNQQLPNWLVQMIHKLHQVKI